PLWLTGGTGGRLMARGSRQGVQSIEVGMRLLDAFAATGTEMTLSSLATAAKMPPSKAHRYLVSLVRARHVEPDPTSSRYTLGGRSLSVGLAALRQLNIVRQGERIVAELHDEVGHTVSMAVWGNRGPTVVRVGATNSALVVTVREGSVLPLLTSANGQH